MRSFAFPLAVVLSALVAGQLADLPSCAQGCVGNYTTGNQIGGCGDLDIACICSSQNFISGISCCLYANCDQADQQTAIAYAHQLCDTANVQVPNSVVCLDATSTFGVVAGATGSTAAASSAMSSPTRAKQTTSASETGTGGVSQTSSTSTTTGPSSSSTPKSAAAAVAPSSSIVQLGLISAAIATFVSLTFFL